MGFSWAEGPYIEDRRPQFYRAEHPRHHPARGLHDTFYLSGLPLCCARTRRRCKSARWRRASPRSASSARAAFSATRPSTPRTPRSSIKSRALVIDEGIGFADLKGTWQMFLESLFGAGTQTRFRPSYFPFTEPSTEVDVDVLLLPGHGLPVLQAHRLDRTARRRRRQPERLRKRSATTPSAGPASPSASASSASRCCASACATLARFLRETTCASSANSMKISYNWLKEHLDHGLSGQELAARLLSLGFEVASVEHRGPTFTGVVVGKILAKDKHPNADQPRGLCVVDDGQQKWNVVCGAPNVAVGQKIALARIGAVLPGNFKIDGPKLRGVETQGMICSRQELGLGGDGERHLGDGRGAVSRNRRRLDSRPRRRRARSRDHLEPPRLPLAPRPRARARGRARQAPEAALVDARRDPREDRLRHGRRFRGVPVLRRQADRGRQDRREPDVAQGAPRGDRTAAGQQRSRRDQFRSA